MKQNDNNRGIDIYVPGGLIQVITIHGTVLENPVGSVVINDQDNYIEVLHIYVEKPYRRQGFARDLVKELQKRYNYIITGWAGSESAGRNLFLSMGFVVKKAMFKNKFDTLEWKRG